MRQDLVLQPVQTGTTVILKAELLGQISALEERLGSLPAVSDQPSLDAVREVMVTASKLAKQVDAQRSNAKAPWVEIAAAIDRAVRPVILRLEAVKIDAKEQIEDFVHEQDRIKREAERAAAVAAAAAAAALAEAQRQQGAAAAPLPQLQVTALPQAYTAPTTRRKVAKVIDITKIPLQFFDLNTERLRQALLNGPVPGAELVEEINVVAR